MHQPASTAHFLPLSTARAKLGESPVWSESDQAVWWVDITGRKLMKTTLDGQTKDWPMPELTGFVQCVAGRILVGMQTGIFNFAPSTSQLDRVVAIAEQGMRFNDACTDSRGRIWAGTMDVQNRRPNGALYLFDPAQNTLDPQLSGFRIINGLAWDDMQNRLYLSDSHASVQTVWTCDIGQDGRLANRAVFARFNDLAGRPDGAAMDKGGHYWIAGVGAGSLYRFHRNGDLIAHYDVPAKSPTKPVFVPENGRSLVLTSFQDDHVGGRLLIWRHPPLNAAEERTAHEENPS